MKSCANECFLGRAAGGTMRAEDLRASERGRCATRKIPYLTRMLQKKKTLTNRIYGLGFTTRKFDRESIVNNCVCVGARALIISWLTCVCVCVCAKYESVFAPVAPMHLGVIPYSKFVGYKLQLQQSLSTQHKKQSLK
jgi:hypothetical protein